jgi:hypothetical protein
MGVAVTGFLVVNDGVYKEATGDQRWEEAHYRFDPDGL